MFFRFAASSSILLPLPPPPRTVEHPATLLPFLFAAWPETKKKQVRTWLKHAAVVVNGRVITQFNHPLKPGDIVAIRSDRFATPGAIVGDGIRIHFEDATLLVIEKPPDLLTVASEAEQEKTAYYQLTDYLRSGDPRVRERIWIVHRLDRETSGLMVFAKTPQAKGQLQTAWDQAEKRYQAVVEGSLPNDQGTFRSWLDETSPYRVFSAPRSPTTRHAVTHYRVLKRSKDRTRTLVELTLETGRRHQIRVHLKDAGCPVVGDKKYGAQTNPARRLALHAWSLRFMHPVTNQELRFEAALPGDLARLV
jgi:23S rRNA pseudouridine1911/1915/1917 synthase